MARTSPANGQPTAIEAAEHRAAAVHRRSRVDWTGDRMDAWLWMQTHMPDGLVAHLGAGAAYRVVREDREMARRLVKRWGERTAA